MNDQPEEKKQKLNLAQKLIEIRKSVPYVKKETEGNKGVYASGSIILGALKAKMDELGVLLEPHILNKTTLHYEQKTQSGSRAMVEVQADMLMVWVDAESGDDRSVPFACFGAQGDIAMAFGTALTYSERYFMLKYFNIPTDKLDHEAFQKKAEDTTTQPEEPKKALSDYTLEIDTCNTIEAVNDWLFDNKDKVKKDLGAGDTEKFRSYVAQLKKSYEPPEQEKPQFITCPQSEKNAPIADCKLSDCHNTCDVYKDAVK